MSAAREFAIALLLMSRLPVRLSGDIGREEQARSVAWYPVVGLVLAVLLMAVVGLLNWLMLPAAVTAALILGVWVALTGALHLDGVADSADAWLGGGGDRERSLRIMKDPACGPAGVVALVLLLLLKFSLLTALLDGGDWLPALLLAPILARAGCSALFLTLPYVRANGLGAAGGETPPHRLGWWMIGLSAVVALLTGLSGLVALSFAVLGFLALRTCLERWLGGFTGDTAGLTTEKLEAVVLFAVVLMQ